MISMSLLRGHMFLPAISLHILAEENGKGDATEAAIRPDGARREGIRG